MIPPCWWQESATIRRKHQKPIWAGQLSSRYLGYIKHQLQLLPSVFNTPNTGFCQRQAARPLS
ncbi:hypothetical protein EMIT053CA3_60266 [Pseudomonas donghuensis]